MNRYSISMSLRPSGRNMRREGSSRRGANEFRIYSAMVPRGAAGSVQIIPQLRVELTLGRCGRMVSV